MDGIMILSHIPPSLLFYLACEVPLAGRASGTAAVTFSSGTGFLGTSGTLKKQYYFLLHLSILKCRLKSYESRSTFRGISRRLVVISNANIQWQHNPVHIYVQRPMEINEAKGWLILWIVACTNSDIFC